MDEHDLSLIKRLEDRLGFPIRETIQSWPNNPDQKHWIIPDRKLHHRGEKRTVMRSIFEIIAGTELHSTHITKNLCGQENCINPAHNTVVQVQRRAIWQPAPLPLKLLNSAISEDDEVEDIRDLLDGTGITDAQGAFDYLDGQYGLHLIQKALTSD